MTIKENMATRAQTEQIFQKLTRIIPGGVNSPVRSCKDVNQLPLIVDRAFRDTLYDVDGCEYIDYCGSWGALIHGHAHPQILHAVQQRMAKGTSFGITCPIEEQLAKKIITLVPSIEKVRFVSSGTEATMSALRLARGFTGRPYIVKFSGNYHGHADFLLVQAGSGVSRLSPTSSSAGIPDDIVKYTISLPYNDIHAARTVLQDSVYSSRIAAVILEPIAGNMGVVPASQEFLNMLREETQKINALLILDEVITGFRVALGGAQSLYKIEPDLTCLGKIMGGGFPAAAFGGRADVMDYLAPLGPVYQAGTLSGNPVAMEAGYQSLIMLTQEGFYQELQRKTHLITKPIIDYLKSHKINVCLQEFGSMFTLFFGRDSVDNMEEARELDVERFAKFFRFMFSQGVYIPPSQYESWFVSYAHSDQNLIKSRNKILEFFESECR